MATERRQQRVEETLKEIISTILLEEEEWPEGVLVTITRMDVSEDLERGMVSVSVYPQSFADAIFSRLEQRVGHIQHLVNRKMRMRPVPKIRFVPEKEVVQADRVEVELYKLHKDE